MLEDNAAGPRLPDFSALSLQTRLTDLPHDLVPQLLIAVHSLDPCTGVERLCAVHSEWAWMCRNGYIYDVANKLLGFYGNYDSLSSMRRQLQQENDLRVWFPPSDPKVYFEGACKLMRDAIRFTDEEHYLLLPENISTRPYFPLLAERVLESNHRFLGQLRDEWEMSARSPERQRVAFRAIAKAAVQEWGDNLHQVPRDLLLLPEYEEIARLAVAETPNALEWVPREAPWFMDLLEHEVLHRAPRVVAKLNSVFIRADDLDTYMPLLAEARDCAQRLADAADADLRPLLRERNALRREEEQNWFGGNDSSVARTERAARMAVLDAEIDELFVLYTERRSDVDHIDMIHEALFGAP